MWIRSLFSGHTAVQATRPSAASFAELSELAIQIRAAIITMLTTAKSGHSAGPLGMTDVFVCLYFAILKHDPQNPLWADRDYVLVSNGHICPVWYATLATAGYFSISELQTLRKFGSRLQGHPHFRSLPGIENTSGPLGLGLSQAIGLAKGLKMQGKPNRVFCVISDGELQEGQTWEALLWGGTSKLEKLCVIIDRNNIQIDGYVEDIVPLEPLHQKLESFGWNVLQVDGHNKEQVIDAFQMANSVQTRPTIIICHTIPGKGVSFMEGDPQWHGKPPSTDQASSALDQIRSLGGTVWWE